MLRITHKNAQAVTELAVFGAILIFIIGAIVRSAVGNSYSQNQELKAMRMALLSSWQGTVAGNIAHNSASILIIEDRLSPDINKYGDLDRNPYLASGSGSFTYQLLYPLRPDTGINMRANMPVMDVWINGQHFPFVTALYRTETITRTSCPNGPPQPTERPTLTQAQCLQNQCLRNYREWVGGIVQESMFENVIPATILIDATCLADPAGPQQRICQADVYASDIFKALEVSNVIDSSGVISDATYTGVLPPSFKSWYAGQNYPTAAGCNTNCQINNIQNIVDKNKKKYKLFYTWVANPGIAGTNQPTPAFSPTAPVCASHPCKDQELSRDLVLQGTSGPVYNTNGDLEYDLLRDGDSNTDIEKRFPITTSCPDIKSMRCNIAWQWAATAATSEDMIGLNPDNNQFPSYDVDGRLAPQTIYGFSYDPATGDPTVSFVDNQRGDYDTTWDSNSCGPKPGLLPDTEIYAFTKDGTYLQIKEGKLFNPETGQVVRSVNKRDTIDLIQRMVQLSNNTGRFCIINPYNLNPTNGPVCNNTDGCPTATPQPCIDGDCKDYPSNPVEVCIAPGSSDNCFSTEHNIKSTCFDENSNMLYVRSRLQDLRGNFWITNTSGQLKVQQ